MKMADPWTRVLTALATITTIVLGTRQAVLSCRQRTKRPGFYRSQILIRYLRSGNPDAAALVDVIKLAGELDSDYYCAEVLQQVAPSTRRSGNARLRQRG